MNEATTETEEDGAVGGSIRTVVLIGLAATTVAAFVGGFRPALGTAIGAAVAAANLWVVAMVVRRLITPGKKSVPWGIVAALKFSLLFGGLYLLIKTGWVDVLPLVIGYGALPLGIVLSRVGGPEPARAHAKRGAS